MELVVAVALLGLALFTTAFSIFNVQNLADVAREKVVAVADSNRVLEVMRQQANASLTLLQNTDWSAWARSNVINSRATNEVRLDQETITVSFAGMDPVRVTLTVDWRNRERAQRHQVITLMTDRG